MKTSRTRRGAGVDDDGERANCSRTSMLIGTCCTSAKVGDATMGPSQAGGAVPPGRSGVRRAAPGASRSRDMICLTIAGGGGKQNYHARATYKRMFKRSICYMYIRTDI